MAHHPPRDIKASTNSRTLTLQWGEDHVGVYPYRELRLACGCAGCVDEWSGRPLLDPATVPADIRITGIDPVGNYAIRIHWSDGHDSGLYTWDRLAALCPCGKCAGSTSAL